MIIDTKEIKNIKKIPLKRDDVLAIELQPTIKMEETGNMMTYVQSLFPNNKVLFYNESMVKDIYLVTQDQLKSIKKGE